MRADGVEKGAELFWFAQFAVNSSDPFWPRKEWTLASVYNNPKLPPQHLFRLANEPQQPLHSVRLRIDLLDARAYLL